MGSNILDEIFQRRGSDVGFVELPFKQYFHVPNAAHSGRTAFSVSTQSLDRVWLTYRPTGFEDAAGLQFVSGYRQSDDTVGYSSALLNTDSEKYTTKYHTFEQERSEATLPVLTQLTINSSSIPQFRANEAEMLQISYNSVDSYTTQTSMSLDQYKKSFYVQCVRLSLPDSDYGRLISGLDTRSTSAQLSVTTTNLETCRLDAFLECHSTLRVGAGRAIEVIV